MASRWIGARRASVVNWLDVRLALLVLAGCGRLDFAAVDGLADGATDSYAAEVLADRPIGYWRLDEASGTVARDAAGAHPGTYDPTCQLGAPGALTSGDTAVRFDGASCVVTIGDAFEFSGSPSFSIEVWASPAIVDDQVRRFVSRSNGTSPGVGYQLAFFSNAQWFEIFDGSADLMYVQSASPAAGAFEHVVIAVDSAAQSLYVDGALAMQADFSLSVPSDPATVTFGDLGPSPGSYYKYQGVLDEIAIYDHALTAARVAAHYAAR
jgi:hypothetical protein